MNLRGTSKRHQRWNERDPDRIARRARRFAGLFDADRIRRSDMTDMSVILKFVYSVPSNFTYAQRSTATSIMQHEFRRAHLGRRKAPTVNDYEAWLNRACRFTGGRPPPRPHPMYELMYTNRPFFAAIRKDTKL